MGQPRSQQPRIELKTRRIVDGRVAVKYASGMYSEADLAKEYGISKNQLLQKVDKFARYWNKEVRQEALYYRAKYLAEFEEVQALAREAYERSRGEKVTKTHEVMDTPDGKKTKVSQRTEMPHGDPRFLTVALSCIDYKCRLNGAYAPTKIAATTPDGEDSAPLAVVNLDKMTEQQLLAYQELVTQVLDVESEEVK